MSDNLMEPILQRLVRREGRSLLQYVSESFPWTAQEDEPAVVRMRAVAAEENAATGVLARYMNKRHMTPPYLGAFPMEFTSINYTSLDFLTPKLIAAQEQAIAALLADLQQITDHDFRERLQTHLAMKQRHLEDLNHLKSPGPAAPPH